MNTLKKSLKDLLKGRVHERSVTLARYSHDASLFEITPELVVQPRDIEDLRWLVSFVGDNKKDRPTLSLTARSGGTDMSGGAINDSIIVDFKKFHHLGRVQGEHIWSQPGVYYRHFEKRTKTKNMIMPSYPASREICKIGGMVANNAGGEKTLTYGKVEDYVTRLRVVCSNGEDYIFEPLNQAELKKKLALKSFEGEIYHQMYELVTKNNTLIKASKPNVHKNSTGYNLWDVWDGKTFDLTKLFVGSQGTLGLVANVQFRLVPVRPYSGLLVVFMPSLDRLADIITTILKSNPTSLESFDDHTMDLAMRFFPSFLKTLGLVGFVKLGISLVPDVFLMLKGLPKLIVLAEFEGDSQAEVTEKINALHESLQKFDLPMERAETAAKSRKYWIMRRESFNLLRHNVKSRHTAPFIDDFVVPPKHLPEFLPRLRKILDKYELLYTIAGHIGEGNFHIIPLMKLEYEEDRKKIEPCMREVNKLVLHYEGSLSGEHNDGLVRGPFLEQMYSPAMMKLFRQTKTIFDPKNIFNPHKKTDATWDYSSQHMRADFREGAK